jgi:hypothetical protein
MPNFDSEIEAIENALTFLETLGYRGGDIHDDLAVALRRIKGRKLRIEKATKSAEDWAKGQHPGLRLPK